MQAVKIGLAALCVAGIGMSGCHHKQKATVDTGTAKATITTTANATDVSPAQLETAAAIAATAASKPVDGSTATTNSMTDTKK